MLKYVVRALCILAVGSPMAYAALQGEATDSQSLATTTITLTIEPNLQISNVGDISIDVVDRNQDTEFEEDICVRGNTGGRYSVTAASDGGNSPFQLTSENGDTIAYQVYFRGDLSRANKDALNPGEASPLYTIQSGNVDCNGSNTAAFTVHFKSEDLLPAAAGTYTGFLTVTAAAE